jgi:hypothetical protein
MVKKIWKKKRQTLLIRFGVARGRLSPSPQRRRKEKSAGIFSSGFFFLLLPSPLLGERRYRGEDVFCFFLMQRFYCVFGLFDILGKKYVGKKRE